MDTAVKPSLSAGEVRAISEAAGEPEWLGQWRHDAWETWDVTPMPDRVRHLWRYTDPDKFLIDKVTPMLPAAAGEVVNELPAGMEETPAAVGIVDDASLHTAWLSPALQEAGVVLADLATAAGTHEEIVREHLGRAVSPDAGKFEALNAALFPGGVFLYVPRGVVVEGPIHLFRRHGVDLSAAFPRLLIVVDEGAEATVIDEYSTPGDPRVVANSVVEGTVLPNGHLNYFNLQRWGDRARSHARQRFLLQRDATVSSVNIALGGQYCKADISNVMQGKNAQSEMIGVTFGSGTQHFDTHTEHVHEVGDSFSDMDFKVVLENEARSAYTGLIRIDLDAPNSEAYQENRNLMLDPTCSAESIPELEILNENVRCTHGATVGPIDQDQVYYLKTRGLPEREAERLIVEGFFGPALDRIDDEGLRERMWSLVADKIAD
ncbi:MAG: Fe-S cluster assembly protein SufD [Acidobacteria bacterium]|nr:Fe-S cluster assembly protein SufD [Acidobacteriota bacterium]